MASEMLLDDVEHAMIDSLLQTLGLSQDTFWHDHPFRPSNVTNLNATQTKLDDCACLFLTGAKNNLELCHRKSEADLCVEVDRRWDNDRFRFKNVSTLKVLEKELETFWEENANFASFICVIFNGHGTEKGEVVLAREVLHMKYLAAAVDQQVRKHDIADTASQRVKIIFAQCYGHLYHKESGIHRKIEVISLSSFNNPTTTSILGSRHKELIEYIDQEMRLDGQVTMVVPHDGSKGYKRWLNACSGLKEVQASLVPIINDGIQQLHDEIKAKVEPLPVCTICRTRDINRATGTFKTACVTHQTMAREILSHHATGDQPGSIPWKNSDATQWCTDAWAIAKLFMDQGLPPANIGVATLSNLCTLMMTCKDFASKGTVKNMGLVETVLTRRDNMMHCVGTPMDDDGMIDALSDMVALLKDGGLSKNPGCAQGVRNLFKLMRR